jgi:hypothetical protein
MTDFARIDDLLKKLRTTSEAVEDIRDDVDWHQIQRFVGWICGHSQRARKAANARDLETVEAEVGRMLFMLTQAIGALGRPHEQQKLMAIAKDLQPAEVAEETMEEKSLSRVYHHFSTGPFGIVSAFRKNLPEEENLVRQFNLGKDVRALGHGYIPIVGRWGGVNERSLFIPDIDRKQTIALGDRYDQEAVIHGDSGKADLIDRSGKVLDTFNRLRVLDLDTDFENYSALKMKGGKPAGSFRLEPTATK